MQRSARIALLSVDLALIFAVSWKLWSQIGGRFGDIWLILSAACLTISLISYIRRSDKTDHYLVSTITALVLSLVFTFRK